MADETKTPDDEAAERAADEQRTEQDRLLALSHADDRPRVSVAAIAPRNRPVDGETRVVTAPEVRSADEFTDPARGLEHAIPDVEHVRRTEGTEAGDEAAEAVLAGDVPPTPSETVPAEVAGPDATERATEDVATEAPTKPAKVTKATSPKK